MSDRHPALNRHSFICPRCDAFAHQEWADLVVSSDSGLWEQYSDIPGTKATMSRWRASRCSSCGRFSTWRGQDLIHPATTTLVERAHELMDPVAKDLYEEASSVLPISRRAAAALARAAMEAQLKALSIGQPNDRLDDRIAALSSQVSEPLWQLLTVLRDTGNRVLHSEAEPGVVELFLNKDDAELAPVLLGAVNQIVEETEARAKRANSLFDLLPEGVRKTAEQKRDRETG